MSKSTAFFAAPSRANSVGGHSSTSHSPRLLEMRDELQDAPRVLGASFFGVKKRTFTTASIADRETRITNPEDESSAVGGAS